MKRRLTAIIISMIMIIPLLSLSGVNTTPTAAGAPYENKIKAVLLNAGIDFTSQTTESEYIEMLDYLGNVGLDTVVINTDNDDERFYSTDIDTLSDDVYPVDSMVSYAKKCGFKVYLIIDFALAMSECESLYDAGDHSTHIVSGIVSRHSPDAVIFDNPYIESNAAYYSEYLSYGGGIGFDCYLDEANHKAFDCALKALEACDDSIQIGLDRVSQDNKNNSEFDFILKNDGDSSYSDIPAIYLCNNGVLQQGNAQQLTGKLVEIDNYENSNGVVFSSYQAMTNDQSASIETVKRYFSNSLDMDLLGNELSISTPTLDAFSTNESSIIFSGNCDPNFDLVINGEAIETDGEGSFSVQKDLNVGQNTFTISNNNSTKVYTITRNVNIFNTSSLTPNADVTVDGSNTLNVSVYAYPGANVSATLNSTTLTMQQTDTTDSAGYKLYQCTFTMPPATISAQGLGRISLYGSFNGCSESISGANVTVAAQSSQNNDSQSSNDKPITSDVISANSGNSVTNASGSVSGTVVKISTDNTTVYPDESTDRIPVPTQMKLAANTIDFLSKTVTYEGVGYYVTKSGRRVKTENAVLLSENTISQNNITANSCYTTGNDTVIKLNQDYKTPYCILYSPITFNNNIYGDWGDYFLNSFSPSTISIVFDYCTAASGGFDFPEGSLFGSSSWRLITVDGTQKVALDLTLSKSGSYSGVTVSYDSEGCIVFSFNGPETAVSDMVIVIDPGHGYISSGEYDPGALGRFSSKGLYCEEASANLGVSIQLEQKLEAMGATVIRLQTENTPYPTDERSDIARQYDPDLFISLHCNGSTSSSAQGSSTYYFQPFAYPLAKAVEQSLGAFFEHKIHGTNKSEGARFDYFYVTTQPDFPSILVEMAYITNYTEASVLTNPDYQSQIAQAIADGIVNYAAGF